MHYVKRGITRILILFQQMFQIQQLPGQSGQQIYIQQPDDQTEGTQDVS